MSELLKTKDLKTKAAVALIIAAGAVTSLVDTLNGIEISTKNQELVLKNVRFHKSDNQIGVSNFYRLDELNLTNLGISTSRAYRIAYYDFSGKRHIIDLLLGLNTNGKPRSNYLILQDNTNSIIDTVH